MKSTTSCVGRQYERYYAAVVKLFRLYNDTCGLGKGFF